MILGKNLIKEYLEHGLIKISPFDPQQLNPASYDLRLDDVFFVYTSPRLDLRKPAAGEYFQGVEELILSPDIKGHDYSRGTLTARAVLAQTQEDIILSKYIAGQYQGKSSLGRAFITSHQTAGYIDPGFKGKITLEIASLDREVVLRPGQRIGQLIFYLVLGAEDYNGNYLYQDKPLPYMPLRD